jgi:tripartite-type tricarboxylate transporter receptor subunit TctC
MFAPAQTSKAVLGRLHAALAKLLAEPAVRERLEGQSCGIIGGSPEALTELIKSEQAKWGRLIREMHISVD